MKHVARVFLILTLVCLCVPSITASATPAPIDTDQALCLSGIPNVMPPGVLYSQTTDGSNFCLWVPAPGFVGDLVIFAHGYVDPRTPDGSLPWDQLAIGGVSLPAMVMGQLHAAFAVTSYPHNGLSVVEGVEAVKELALTLEATPGITIQHVYVVGASEGGLVTALAIEQNPNSLYAGGVSTCGPVGDFVQQVNYWGDFRVAYDYYFQKTGYGPALLTTPISIDPVQTIGLWGAFDPAHPESAGSLQQLVYAKLAAHPDQALKLVNAGRAPFDSANPTTTIPASILGILDYNVRATDQARGELSGVANAYLTPNVGNPYGNAGRWIGGLSDLGLNLWVQSGHDKFTANPAALAAIKNYQTTGKLNTPLVTLHTTGDPIVPYWHELLYAVKVWGSGHGSELFSIPIVAYGHCNFTAQQAMFAYLIMVYKATGTLPVIPTVLAPNSTAVLNAQQFDDMMNQYGPTLNEPPHVNYMPIIVK